MLSEAEQATGKIFAGLKVVYLAIWIAERFM